MQPSERRAEAWLTRLLGKRPTFHSLSTPDFTTDNGESWEIKMVGKNNIVSFSHGQIEKVIAANAMTVIFGTEGETPLIIIPPSELRVGRYSGYLIRESPAEKLFTRPLKNGKVESTFAARIQRLGRFVIPPSVAEALALNRGDLVVVKVSKLEVSENGT